MTSREPLLIQARRISDALALQNPRDRIEQNSEEDAYHHFASGFYLLGALAYLEGAFTTKRNERAWRVPGFEFADFDAFVVEEETKHPGNNYTMYKTSSRTLTALHDIRNAFAHNECDLTKNDNHPRSLERVSEAALPGVNLAVDGTFTLGKGFLQTVRMAFVAVCQYHGRR